MSVSPGFAAFNHEAPETSSAFSTFVATKASESALDEKTQHLAYLAVLVATDLTEGIGFHVALAQKAGASRDEIISAALVGISAVGVRVMNGLAAVVDVLDE